MFGKLGDAHAVGSRQVGDEKAIGLAKFEFDRQVVDLSHDGRFAIDYEILIRIGLDRRVGLHLFPPEENVGGGEKFAIGPANPFAQVEGIARAILANFPTFGDVGDDFAAFHIPAHQVFIAIFAEFRQTATIIEVEHFATILADALKRGDDDRMHGQPIGGGGQGAGRNQLRQLRRFVDGGASAIRANG